MTDNGPAPAPRRKHLLSPEDLERGRGSSSATDLTRRRGESNGLRVHGISFAVMSLVALILIIVAIAIAGTAMMMT